MVGAVDAVVDGDKTDVRTGKEHFRVVSDFEVVSAETAHVFDDDCADAAFFCKRNEALPVRAVEVRATVPVINEKLRVAEPVVVSVLLEYGFLILDTVAVALQFIVT